MMSKPEVQKMCVAKYSDEEGTEGWYRAVIEELYPEIRKAVVYFIDYGNYETVSYANLGVYSSQSKYLPNLPPQLTKKKNKKKEIK